MVNVENQIVGKSGRRIMLTESTCKNAYALLSLCVGNTTEMQIFKQLIKEYFELVKEFETYKNLDDLVKSAEKFYTNETYFAHIIKVISTCNDEEVKDYAIHCLSYLKQKIDSFENPQAYKFEELHEEMWVFDIVYKSVFYLVKVSKNKKIKTTHGWLGEFEENRFFPVTKAMYRGEKV